MQAQAECIAGNGNDTINFNITGAADFVNSGQNGYTIKPNSQLPQITQTLNIDGYSQAGSQANTAVSPNPFNGILLIEIDGSNAGGLPGASHSLIIFSGGSVASELSGLIVNNHGFGQTSSGSSDPSAVLVGDNDINIYGNYIGTDHTGLIRKENLGCGICQNGGADNTKIGGLLPRQRNIISGNYQTGISPNSGSSNWIIRGNYIGVGSDGITPIPNSSIAGSGALSIDNDDNHIIGGPQVGATNVISGNNSFAVIPDHTNNLIIQGNIIGPDWKGDPIPGSPQTGGIGAIPFASDITNLLIGGVNAGESNHIAYNKGPAVLVASLSFGASTEHMSTNVSILGNSIHDNDTGVYPLSAASGGIGIDLMGVDMTTFTPFNGGPTLNDASDADTGANGYINFPDIDSATQTGTSLAINLDLDAADSPSNQYRVEFFANDIADPSGYGEGQTFLGYALLNSGSGQLVNLTLPTGLDLTGKFISSTTTAIDASTPSGFGSTSEFSPLTLPIIKVVETTTSTTTSVVPPPSVGVGSGSSNLPATGVFSSRNVTLALILISFGSLIITVRKRRPLLWQNRN